MISTILGFILNWIPDLFKGVTNYFQAKQDHKFEMEKLKFMAAQEERRYQLQKDKMIVQAEVTEALVGLQAEVANNTNALMDRTGARDYGQKMVSIMDHTLGRAKQLGVWQWMVSIGWAGVLFIESVSASVQPALVVMAFVGLYTTPEGKAIIPAVMEELVLTIVGFYLGGRLRKFEMPKRVLTATGQEK